MEILDFHPDYGKPLSAIANDAFEDEIQRGMTTFDEDYFKRRAEIPGTHIWVGIFGGKAIGFIVLTEGGEEVPSQIHLLAVDRRYRGRGFGKMLMRRALDCWMGLLPLKIKLGTRPWNKDMRKICVDLGFVPEAYLKMEYLGEDIVQYALFK